MAYENIRLVKRNVVVVDGYFYMMDDSTDSLIVKTDDGTQAYSYPLDTTLNAPILSLEHDGRNFWSLEKLKVLSGTQWVDSADSIVIRRWYIDNYVCKLRQTINLNGTLSHKYSSEAFTVEHYHTTFTSYESIGQSSLSIADGSKLSSGYTVVLGPNSNGDVEEFSVSSAGSDFVNINGTITKAYEAGDTVSFYKTIWLFNNYDGVNADVGALYKLNAYTGAYQTHYAGGEYQDIKACTFFDIPYYVFNTGSVSIIPKYNVICYIKTTNMLFLNPDDISNSIGSMSMDNVEDNQSVIIPIYDVTIEGTNVYRLQSSATYYGTTTDFLNGTYNYQLSTLKSFVTSVSLRAEPAILPANGINQSLITAIVRDQFNQPVQARLVTFTEDDGTLTQDQLSLSEVNTDGDGVAQVYYTSGTTAREVRISATVNHS